MSRFTRKSSKKAGSSPGTLIYVGEKKADDIHISVLHYNAETLTERPLSRVDDALPFQKPDSTTWINIDGIHDIPFMENIGKLYGIHPLTLEDVLNTTQRPKTEAFDDYLFLVMKMLHFDKEKDLIFSEQISLILGKNFLISFQEAAGDVFNPIRERIRKGKGRIRTGGCDYLAYALIDAIVDNYFVILERLGERLQALEETIDDHPDAAVLEAIHAIRRELIYLRKQVWPLREIIAHLQKDGAPFVGEAVGPFLRDVYDHTIQTIDTIESFRDILSRHAGSLPVHHQQPNERGDEGADHHCHHLHPHHLCRRALRHELYPHARVDLALGLSVCVDDHSGHYRWHACFFQAQEVVMNRPLLCQVRVA